MKELDVALNAYLDKRYVNADPELQQQFQALLELQDPYLYQLVCKNNDDERFRTIVQEIRHSLIS